MPNNLERPCTLSSLPLEFPVLHITQTVDLIKLLITSWLTTELFYLINKLFSKTKVVQTLPAQFMAFNHRVLPLSIPTQR